MKISKESSHCKPMTDDFRINKKFLLLRRNPGDNRALSE